MSHDKRDATAFYLIPDDVGVNKEKLFPVNTTGDGSCFYYALSHLVCGDESHCVEMRVRVIVEGVKNMNLYLNHEYLCRGYDFPHHREDNCTRIYTTYCSFYRPGMSLDPHTPVTSLRQDMNQLILPMDLDGPNIATIVQIM